MLFYKKTVNADKTCFLNKNRYFGKPSWANENIDRELHFAQKNPRDLSGKINLGTGILEIPISNL